MSFSEKIAQEFKGALKAKNEIRLSTLRMLKSALQYAEIGQARIKLTDDDVVKTISTLCKQRKESIEQFKKGGREDLVQKEEKELEILQEFLPAQLGPEELESIVKEAIRETGATSMKEMGQVMKVVMAKVPGRADGKLVNQIVRSKLS